MKTFKDTKGDTWTIDVTVGDLLAIKSHVGVNLLDEPASMPKSIEKLVDILWCCVKTQLEHRGLSPEDFASRLDGKVISSAVDSFMESFADFFLHLEPEKTTTIRWLWNQSKDAHGIRMELVEKALSCISIALQEQQESTQEDLSLGS